MDTDQIKGKLQNAFGKVEEAVGEAVGSQNLANAGAEDRLKGAATETWGNTKDTVRSVGETAHTQAEVDRDRTVAHGETLRDRIVGGAEHLKDSINSRLDHTKANESAERDDLRPA